MAVQLKEYLRSPMAESSRALILDILIKKWNSVFESEESERREMLIIINLFECFQSVVFAFGSYIEPFAIIIFHQCFKIVQRFNNLALQDDEYLEKGIVYFSISINLLSSLFNALNRQAQMLIL
jgi:hypothetical protein